MNVICKYGLWLILFTGVLCAGCREESIEEDEEAPENTQKLNGFIKEVMSNIYLWYDKLPSIDIRYETDSKAYFYKLLYSEDKWSYITDDITAFENSLEGIEKTYGYALAFGRFLDATGNFTGNYFAIVEYVYPNSPAFRAGLNRGDLITRINNVSITESNYKELYYSTSVTLTKGTYTTSGIATDGTLSMTAEELNLDPVLMYKVIQKEGHRIGYLVYLQYITSYDDTSLKTALQYFRDNQITDLILDLRYNPGGQTAAAQYLCSSLAPLNTVNNGSTLVSFQWNEKYQSYWTSKNNQSQLGVKFNSSVPVKLGLSKLTVLTGDNTASASELTICGLEPYMDVTLVGDTTYGKYTASTTIKPEDWYDKESEYSSFKNWGLQPIIIRFANANGVTNFKNGFTPNYLVDDALLPAYPLGDLTEPLLKKAVEHITGVQIAALKKAEAPFRFEIFDHGSSRFDNQKRNLFLEKDVLKMKNSNR